MNESVRSDFFGRFDLSLGLKILQALMISVIISFTALPVQDSAGSLKLKITKTPISHSQKLNEPQELETIVNSLSVDHLPANHVPDVTDNIVIEGETSLINRIGSSDLEKHPQVTASMTNLGSINPMELQAFLDTYFAEQMSALHIPGATFVLVKDGK
jgi:hypothetical protein